MHLGAGRKLKEDNIDYCCSIMLNVKPGSKVKKGDVLAYLHTNINDFEDITNKIRMAFNYSEKPVAKSPIIHEIIE